MTVNSGAERLGYGAPDGCVALGQHINVISEGVAARTLTAKESGSVVVFDLAASTTFTLPSPSVGCYFDFVQKIAGSGTWTITTGSAAIFMTGGVQIGSETPGQPDSFAANGTSHWKMVIDGDTKGRVLGGMNVRILCLSATQWHVSGWMIGAGTVATPFA
jgi:hypothetical protein